MTKQPTTAERIRDTNKTGKPVDFPLKTSQKILARITEGIYRQPASALRELISNAYDADATKVTIKTDAPRFSEISIRDNGIGISPEALQHLIENIGGSAKRTETGEILEITGEDTDFSPKGRKLIGKLGIGLFAVVQFSRHFLIITKSKGETFRTIADVTLGELESKGKLRAGEIITGEVRVWTEKASNKKEHGTEIKLLDLLPRTRAELCSLARWELIDFEAEQKEKQQTEAPVFHIGRMDTEKPDELLEQPKLPWKSKDQPDVKFQKLVNSIRGLAKKDRELVDLDSVCDNYLQTLWSLALACPLDYIEGHPFDLPKSKYTKFFVLKNQTRGQSDSLGLESDQTPREKLNLKTPMRSQKDKFELFIDGIQITRPILFTNQPKTGNSIKTPLLFIGQCREEFGGKPVSLSGGPLEFEAYLFWTPKVLPKQHRGVMLRVGNASGATFDPTFMNYQVSEQTRLRQITAEIFVHEGLDGAINLDRESFNFSHPHYQFLVKWLHSAIRQLTNRHKAVGKELREDKITVAHTKTKKSIERAITEKLLDVGVEDAVEVEFIKRDLFSQTVEQKRDEGIVAFQVDTIFKKESSTAITESDVNKEKAKALTQLLYGWGLLDNLSFDDQATLVRDIMEIMLLEETK